MLLLLSACCGISMLKRYGRYDDDAMIYALSDACCQRTVSESVPDLPSRVGSERVYLTIVKRRLPSKRSLMCQCFTISAQEKGRLQRMLMPPRIVAVAEGVSVVGKARVSRGQANRGLCAEFRRDRRVSSVEAAVRDCPISSSRKNPRSQSKKRAWSGPRETKSEG